MSTLWPSGPNPECISNTAGCLTHLKKNAQNHAQLSSKDLKLETASLPINEGTNVSQCADCTQKSVAHKQKTNTGARHTGTEDIVWKGGSETEKGMLKNPDEMKWRNKKG